MPMTEFKTLGFIFKGLNLEFRLNLEVVIKATNLELNLYNVKWWQKAQKMDIIFSSLPFPCLWISSLEYD